MPRCARSKSAQFVRQRFVFAHELRRAGSPRMRCLQSAISERVLAEIIQVISYGSLRTRPCAIPLETKSGMQEHRPPQGLHEVEIGLRARSAPLSLVSSNSSRRTPWHVRCKPSRSSGGEGGFGSRGKCLGQGAGAAKPGNRASRFWRVRGLKGERSKGRSSNAWMLGAAWRGGDPGRWSLDRGEGVGGGGWKRRRPFPFRSVGAPTERTGREKLLERLPPRRQTSFCTAAPRALT